MKFLMISTVIVDGEYIKAKRQFRETEREREREKER
jgi:hypothetical protein